jgi:hypothetical protein
MRVWVCHKPSAPGHFDQFLACRLDARCAIANETFDGAAATDVKAP